MKKNVLIGLGSFILGAMLFVGLGTTLAANDNSANAAATGNGNAVRAQFNTENREAIDQAIQSGDYNTWKGLMENTRMGEELLAKVNESNFNRFAEAHKIMQEAKEKSQAIFDELGIEKPQGPGKGKGKGIGGPKGGCPFHNQEQNQAATQDN